MKVCVVGLGYVGLPTGALLATKGMRVHGVDTDAALIEAIKTAIGAAPKTKPSRP